MAVVCADVMFNIQTPYIRDEALVSFATKHDIKKMVNSDGTIRWYGCRRGLSYTKDKKCDWPDGIGAPPCDLWNLGEAVKFIMQACDEGSMACEYAAGNVLGIAAFHVTSYSPRWWTKTIVYRDIIVGKPGKLQSHKTEILCLMLNCTSPCTNPLSKLD